jgi:hypothetical protein
MALDSNVAKTAVASVRADIAAIDEEFMRGTMSVSHALDDLAQALEDVDACLDKRQHEKSAELGYGAVSTGFVYLQRTLGELSRLEHRKALIVQELARKLRCAYEEISPYVDALMESMQPPRPITISDAAELEAASASFRARGRSGGEHLAADTRSEYVSDNDDGTEQRRANLERAMGFGSVGWRKARALYRSVKSTPTRAYPVQLPDDTWSDLVQESERLSVERDQVIQAAIESWLETNPKKTK